jgi:hypothetical protein
MSFTLSIIDFKYIFFIHILFNICTIIIDPNMKDKGPQILHLFSFDGKIENNRIKKI